jgi:hypothetical protein
MPNDLYRLKGRQQRFVEEYLVCANATEAALKAGYSPRTAGQIGYENLRKPDICEALSKAQARVQERAEMTAAQAVVELAVMARDPNQPGGVRVSASREINDMLGFHAPPKGRTQEEVGLLVIHDMPDSDAIESGVTRAAVAALPPAEPEENPNGA